MLRPQCDPERVQHGRRDRVLGLPGVEGQVPRVVDPRPLRGGREHVDVDGPRRAVQVHDVPQPPAGGVRTGLEEQRLACVRASADLDDLVGPPGAPGLELRLQALQLLRLQAQHLRQVRQVVLDLQTEGLSVLHVADQILALDFLDLSAAHVQHRAGLLQGGRLRLQKGDGLGLGVRPLLQGGKRGGDPALAPLLDHLEVRDPREVQEADARGVKGAGELEPEGVLRGGELEDEPRAPGIDVHGTDRRGVRCTRTGEEHEGSREEHHRQHRETAFEYHDERDLLDCSSGCSGSKTGLPGHRRFVGTVSRRDRMRSRAYFNTLSRIRKPRPLVGRDEICYSSTVCRVSSRGCPLSPDAAPPVGGGCCRAVRDCAKRFPQ